MQPQQHGASGPTAGARPATEEAVPLVERRVGPAELAHLQPLVVLAPEAELRAEAAAPQSPWTRQRNWHDRICPVSRKEKRRCTSRGANSILQTSSRLMRD